MMGTNGQTNGIAKIISQMLHPYVFTIPILVLLAMNFNPDDWLKWVVITLSPAYFIPLVFMQTRVIQVIQKAWSREGRSSRFQGQSWAISLMVCLFCLLSTLTLFIFSAPAYLMAMLIGLGVTSLLFTMVGLRYRTSLHLSLFASVVTSAIILIGPPAFFGFTLTLLLGVSRHCLGENTPLELVAGGLLGLITTMVVFGGFKLL